MVRNKTGDHQIRGLAWTLNSTGQHQSTLPLRNNWKKRQPLILVKSFPQPFTANTGTAAWGLWRGSQPGQGSSATSEQKDSQPYFIQMTWSYKFPKAFRFLKELRHEVKACSCMVMALTQRPSHGKMRGTQQYPKLQLLLMVLAPFCPWPLALCCSVRPGGGGGGAGLFYLLFQQGEGLKGKF